MPPLDVKLTIHNQVWTLLEASSAFTDLVKAGSRLKATDRNSWEKDRAKTTPAHFPKVRVEVEDETDGDTSPEFFGQNSTNFSAAVCDYGVKVTVNLAIKIIHDKKGLEDQSPVEAAVRGALWAKGRNLGIAWVTRIQPRGITSREEVSEDTNNTLRPITRIRLVVTAMPKLSQLTAT